MLGVGREELECFTESECPEVNPSPRCACFPHCKKAILPGKPCLSLALENVKCKQQRERYCSPAEARDDLMAENFHCQGTAARGAASLPSATDPFCSVQPFLWGLFVGFLFKLQFHR